MTDECRCFPSGVTLATKHELTLSLLSLQAIRLVFSSRLLRRRITSCEFLTHQNVLWFVWHRASALYRSLCASSHARRLHVDLCLIEPPRTCHDLYCSRVSSRLNNKPSYQLTAGAARCTLGWHGECTCFCQSV